MDIPVRVLLHMVNLGALSGLASSLGAAAAAQTGLASATKPVAIGLTAAGAAMGAVAAAAAVMAAAVLTAGAAIATALAGLIYDSIKVAMSFETSFANVKKALDGTPEQLNVVRQGLLDLSLQVPVSPNQLASIAALGAQLGVSRKDMVEFTRTVAVLGTAVDGMTMEEATNQVAKFAAVMGNSNDWNLIANVLVDLGNKGNSTEKKIIQMATRIGAAGNEIGMTIPAVLGLSAALANVGVEPFRGGTAAQRVIIALRDAALDGGPKLAVFAKIAGYDVPSAFANMVKTNPDKAIRDLMVGMTTTSERGINLAAALASVGIKGELAKLTFLQLKGSGDLVKKAFDDATNAARNNNAAFEEARKKWETAANQLQLLRNAFEVIQINIGTAFLPAIAAVAETLRPVLLMIAILTRDLGPQGATGVLVNISKTITGMFLVSLAYVLNALGQQVKQFGALKYWVEMTQAAFVLFGGKVAEVFSRIQSFFGQTVAAANSMKIADSLKAQAVQMAKDATATKTGLDKVAAGMIQVGVVALQAASGQKGLSDKLMATGKTTSVLGTELKKTGKNLWDVESASNGLGKAQERAAKAAAKLSDSIGTKGLAKEVKAMEKAIQDVLGKGGALTAEGIDKVGKLAAQALQAGLTLPPGMQQVYAQKLAEDGAETLKKAQDYLKKRIEQQGGVFSFEELRRAAMAVRSDETGVGAQLIGEGGLWTVDPETIEGFRDIAAEARKAEEATVAMWQAIASGFETVGETLDALDGLFDEFGISGDSALRQITQGLASAAGAAATFVQGLATGDPAAMIKGVAQMIGTIKDMLSSDSGATRAAGGALAGFLVGGIPGAIVGAIIGGLRKPSWQKVAEEAGNVLGEKVSKEMAKEIEKRAKEMNITIRGSALLSLGDVMKDSERGPLEFAAQIGDLMRAIKDGTVPVTEGMKVLADVTAMVIEELEGMGAAGSAMIGDLLEAARAGGMLTEQMRELAEASGKEMADGMKKMFEAINNGLPMSAENVSKLGELAAFTYSRLRDMGFSMVEAMEMLGPAIDEAIKAIEASGATVGPMLQSMIEFRQRVLDNKELVSFAEGLNQMGESALRMGLALDPAAVQNFGDLTTQAFNDLRAAGFTAEQATSMLGGSMRTLNELAERGVIVLTEEQQAMLEVARANGDLDPEPQKAMLEVMEQMRDILRDVARAFGVVTSETKGAKGAAEEWERALRNLPSNIAVRVGYTGGNPPPNTIPPMPPPPGGSGEGGGGDDDNGEGYSTGGVVIAPLTGKSVTVHGREAITPLEQVYGKMADIVATRLAKAGEGAGSSGTITVHAPIYIAGHKVDEVIIERARAGHITISRESIDG